MLYDHRAVVCMPTITGWWQCVRFIICSFINNARRRCSNWHDVCSHFRFRSAHFSLPVFCALIFHAIHTFMTRSNLELVQIYDLFLSLSRVHGVYYETLAHTFGCDSSDPAWVSEEWRQACDNIHMHICASGADEKQQPRKWSCTL